MNTTIIVFGLFLVLFFPREILAHLDHPKPFILINGQFTSSTHIKTINLNKLSVPQEFTNQGYLISHPIIFELNQETIPMQQELVSETVFTWDFGDGNSAEGLSVQHEYKKIGSYLVTLSVTYKENSPVELRTILLNVIPTSDYKLPDIKIYLQDKLIDDSEKPITSITGQPLKLNIALNSSSDEFASYTWDLGDGNTSSDISFNYTFSKDITFAQPILKVVDKKGFISFHYAQVNFADDDLENKKDNKKNSFLIPGFLVLLTLAFLILRRKLFFRT